jgi:hypothetical protein
LARLRAARSSRPAELGHEACTRFLRGLERGAFGVHVFEPDPQAAAGAGRLGLYWDSVFAHAPGEFVELVFAFGPFGW